MITYLSSVICCHGYLLIAVIVYICLFVQSVCVSVRQFVFVIGICMQDSSHVNIHLFILYIYTY